MSTSCCTTCVDSFVLGIGGCDGLDGIVCVMSARLSLGEFCVISSMSHRSFSRATVSFANWAEMSVSSLSRRVALSCFVSGRRLALCSMGGGSFLGRTVDLMNVSSSVCVTSVVSLKGRVDGSGIRSSLAGIVVVIIAWS